MRAKICPCAGALAAGRHVGRDGRQPASGVRVRVRVDVVAAVAAVVHGARFGREFEATAGLPHFLTAS